MIELLNSAKRHLRVPFIQLGVVVLFVLVIAVSYTKILVWGPMRDAQMQARTDVITARRAIDSLNARTALASDVMRLEQELETLDARFSKQVDRAQTVAVISAISEASGSRIIHGSNSFGEPRGNTIPVEQELTLEGPYPAIRRFFQELASIDSFTVVRSVEITADQDGRQVRSKVRLITISESAGQ